MLILWTIPTTALVTISYSSDLRWWAVYYRIHPSKDWIQSQIPEIVQNGVKGLRDDSSDIDDMDAEAFVQAYVNIVAGACISLGKLLCLFITWYVLSPSHVGLVTKSNEFGGSHSLQLSLKKEGYKIGKQWKKGDWLFK